MPSPMDACPHLPMSSLKLDSGRITSGETSHQETKLQASEVEVCIDHIISRGGPPGLGGSEQRPWCWVEKAGVSGR